MRRSTILIPTGVLAVAGVLTGTVLWLTPPSYDSSYDDRVQDCAHALRERNDAGAEGRPEVCEGVKRKDYAALVADVGHERS
ncbi:hypothetical protein C9F11_40290 [Streptomyces sp. YIM 121038]|uniref:hypothetical protein n=1 Tax=Streptomyces sp. YIM 121038 TaxID=2136401 RepID=UPI001110A2CC|nr:hypothetical protein [Streptomyces sp. YIM 121038]QCX81640.1 hypothetical protein C9F11_40290 [Streptomyces sp. YIM 121038]